MDIVATPAASRRHAPFRTFLAAAALLATACLAPFAAAQAADPTGLVIDQSLTVPQANVPGGQLAREFRYYRPATLRGAVPMVIYLHGGELDDQYATGTGAVSHRWLDIADRDGALVVFPNGTNYKGRFTMGANKGLDNLDTTGRNQHWNDCRRVFDGATPANDVAFIRALVRWAEAKAWTAGGGFTVDPQRIYVTGASNGGAMVYRLALESADVLAGAAAMIADLPTDANNQCTVSPSRFVPLFMLFGTADRTMAYGGNAGTCTTNSPSAGCLRSAEETRQWWIQQYGDPTFGSVPATCPSGSAQTMSASGERRCSYADVRTDDGGTSLSSSRVYSLAYAGTASAPIQVLTVEKGGHLEPSVSISQALFQATLGAQNRDIESVDEAWKFLRTQVCAGCVVMP